MSGTAAKSILVVEDDHSLRTLLVDHLGQFGHEVIGAASGQEARKAERARDPDLVLIDVRLPDCSGIDLLIEFVERRPVIVMTAFGSVDQAIKAVRSGASDYLVKPITPEAIELAVARVFATAELKRDVAYWQSQARRAMNVSIVGNSPELTEMCRLAELYAKAGAAVLIEGESGTGKELVARAIHDASDRAEHRFVPIDCDTSDEKVTADELFGHEAGAFQGADTRREGMLEYATHGTLYLSDIADVSPSMQSRLLRVLETGTFRRFGGAEDITTDARIIVGSSQDLHEQVEKNAFRSELFFRLAAYRIQVPALRDRVADILPLAHHFLQHRSFKKGLVKELAPETVAALEAYDWPGNVRELRNAIERGIIVSGPSAQILPEHVSFGGDMGHSDRTASSDPHAVSLQFAHEPSLDSLRAAYLSVLLERHEGNRRKVAEILGISERNTYRLIKKLGAS